MPMPKRVKAGAAAYRAFYDAARAKGATHKQAVAAWKKHKKAHKSAPKAAKKTVKRGAKKSAKRSPKKTAKGGGRKANGARSASYEARVKAWRKSKPAPPPRGLSHIAHKKVIVKKFHDWLKAYAWHLGFSRTEANQWAAMVLEEVNTNLDAAAKHAAASNTAKANAAIAKANERARVRAAAWISRHPTATPAKIAEVKKKIEQEAMASAHVRPRHGGYAA
jgi:hypothetical protein